MPGHTLIDAAAKVCGSRYKLAKRLGLSQSYLSMVCKGERALAPLTAARIAEIAGLDPQQALTAATIENEKDPDKREALKQLFSRAGAAAMLAFCIVGGSLQPSPATAAASNDAQDTTGGASPLYIMSSLRRALKWLRGGWKYPPFALRAARPH